MLSINGVDVADVGYCGVDVGFLLGVGIEELLGGGFVGIRVHDGKVSGVMFKVGDEAHLLCDLESTNGVDLCRVGLDGLWEWKRRVYLEALRAYINWRLVKIFGVKAIYDNITRLSGNGSGGQ